MRACVRRWCRCVWLFSAVCVPCVGVCVRGGGVHVGDVRGGRVQRREGAEEVPAVTLDLCVEGSVSAV